MHELVSRDAVSWETEVDVSVNQTRDYRFARITEYLSVSVCKWKYIAWGADCHNFARADKHNRVTKWRCVSTSPKSTRFNH